MLRAVLNLLFGCVHPRTTFPLTVGRKSSTWNAPTMPEGTYVVCLECGKEFQYDWKTMRIGEPLDHRGTAVGEGKLRRPINRLVADRLLAWKIWSTSVSRSSD